MDDRAQKDNSGNQVKGFLADTILQDGENTLYLCIIIAVEGRGERRGCMFR